MPNCAPTSDGLLAPLKQWLQDQEVSEILLNKPQEIYVERKGEFTCHKVPEFTEYMLNMLFQLIANENDQEINLTKPLLSASLLDNSRIQLVLPPTAKHHTFAIRRKIVRNFTLEHYQSSHFYDQAKSFNRNKNNSFLFSDKEKTLLSYYQREQWDEFIRLAIELKKNIIISGGTSSGKTTFLNACLRHIPTNERIIVLEDTREVDIPHPNKVQLLASKGDQGLAHVSMQELVQACLRLRPDRIIMGEIRGKEIMDFISACSTGHEGSITSIHANNPKIAFMRMTQMYKQNNVPSMSDEDIMRELTEVTDIIIQLSKTKQGRKVQSIYYNCGN